MPFCSPDSSISDSNYSLHCTELHCGHSYSVFSVPTQDTSCYPVRSLGSLPEFGDYWSLLGSVSLARTSDHTRQITNGDIKREIDGGEDEGEEDPPTSERADEGHCTSSLLRQILVLSVYTDPDLLYTYFDQFEYYCSVARIIHGLEEVCAGKQRERYHEAGKDDDKGNVCTQSCNEIDATEEAHEKQPKRC